MAGKSPEFANGSRPPVSRDSFYQQQQRRASIISGLDAAAEMDRYLNRPKCYLAGKAKGVKWDLIKGLEQKINFFATDMEVSPRGCFRCYAGDAEHIVNSFIQQIEDCSFLLAVLDTVDSYGSIAEIAWASAFRKPVYLVIINNFPSGESVVVDGQVVGETFVGCTGGGHGCERSGMEDAYWFVSMFPGVDTRWVDDLSEAKSAVWSICGKKAHSDYLKSPEWSARRRAALDRANHRCQLCNATQNLNVHHRTYENWGKEQPEDLTVLCEDCHAKFHDKVGGGN